MTHDDERDGTTTLFAAIDMTRGKVIASCKPRHGHQEWVQFLKRIDAETPEDLNLHLIVDNNNNYYYYYYYYNNNNNSATCAITRACDRFLNTGNASDLLDCGQAARSYYATHKHPMVKAWLKRHKRFHVRFIPTSSSRLNVIGRFFRDLDE